MSLAKTLLMDTNSALISLIIPTRNQVKLLARLLDGIALAATDHVDHPPFELIIVDNASDDAETLDYLASLSEHPLRRLCSGLMVLPYPHAFNFSAIINTAVARARGELLCLLNDDIEVIAPDWLSRLASLAVRPDVGCVGAKLHYTNQLIQHAGVVIGMDRVAGHVYRLTPPARLNRIPYFQRIQEVSAVTGACLMLRRELFDEVGGMDERLPSDFNDVDLCLTVREAGYQNLWTPHASLFHHESASRGRFSSLPPDEQARRRREGQYARDKWGALLHDDPHWMRRRGLFADDSWPRQRSRVLQHRFEHIGNRVQWDKV